MSNTIRGQGKWSDEHVVPAEGDLADPSSVGQAFQSLADNSRWLYEVLTNSGITLVRRVPDTAGLKQLVGMPDGAVASIPRVGPYFFVAGLTIAEAPPWIVAPNQGAGRWVLAGEALRNVAAGLCTLDSAGKVPSAQLRFSTVDRYVLPIQGNFTWVSTDAVFYDITDAVGRVNGVKAGDLLDLRAVVVASSPATPADSKGTIEARFAIGQTFTPPFPAATTTTVFLATIALDAQYMCTAADATAGFVQATVQVRLNGASGFGARATCMSYRLELVRP
jgi:hypothetical protein